MRMRASQTCPRNAEGRADCKASRSAVESLWSEVRRPCGRRTSRRRTAGAPKAITVPQARPCGVGNAVRHSAPWDTLVGSMIRVFESVMAMLFVVADC